MKQKYQRFLFLGIGFLSLTIGVSLILWTLQEEIIFFYSPTQLAELSQLPTHSIRIGGLVVEDSMRQAGQEVRFKVTDHQKTIEIRYQGILPSLFREGQGIVAKGIAVSATLFEAKELLAKHDERYMPPEVAKTLKESGKWRGDGT